MLSFTIAHAAVVVLRVRKPSDELAFRAWPNVRARGVEWPVFAILGGLATASAWVVVVVQDAPTRYAGLTWLAIGLVTYVVYRRVVIHRPLGETVRAPVLLAPAEGVEYTRLLVPVVEGLPSDEAMEVAARLAAERRARIVAITVLEVPLQLPLDAELPKQENQADAVLDEARAIGDSYGVDVITRIVRGRRAGRAIVDEAMRRNAEIVVMGAPRRERRGKAIFGETVDFVLKHAPCRVMVAAAKAAA
jgi:APA family basic amino acid/polyamine antiporter